MHWAEEHVDPLLALRNAVCNHRWPAIWEQIVLYRQEQQVLERLAVVAARKPPPPAPMTFASLKAAALLPDDDLPHDEPVPQKQSWRPAPDHPWRNNKWPTKEAWRWN
jgi:hypothetical protein